MAHGEKYTITFKNNVNEAYTLKIYEKDYTGDITTVVGTADFVLHKWQEDDPFAPVKGSVLEFKLINVGGALPITSFFAIDDDFYLVKLFHGSDLKFVGYIVQDDCSEPLVDYTHEITLSATDNLGLLKDIDLGQAAVTFGTETDYPFTIEQTSTHQIRLTGLFGITGESWVRINSGTALDGLYSINTWQYISGTPAYTQINFDSPLNGTVVGSLPGTILTFIVPVDLTQRMYISELLALCLKSTGLLLDTNVYLTLKANGTPNNRLFDNVILTPESFNSNNKWASCYDILAKIMARFNASLLQADGVWNIVRWYELRPSTNLIPGVKYDSDFIYQSSVSLDTVALFGRFEETYPLHGLLSSIIRPYQRVVERFMYKNPANLIKNINLDEVGEILQVTTTLTERTVDYALIGWEQGFTWTTGGGGYIGSSATRILRIIYDLSGNVKDRYIIIRGDSGFDDYACAQSNGVEISEGDIVKISFDVKTVESQPGLGNIYFRIHLLTTLNPVPRSTNNRYLNGLGKWNPQGFTGAGGMLVHLQIPVGDNTDTYHTVTVNSDPAPTSGILHLKLAQCVLGVSSTKETHYKNIRVEVVRNSAGSNKATGHQHTYQQLSRTKNKDESEIYIDNSPSNSIAGTTYLASFTGPVQDRTTEWNYNLVDYQQLGQAITRETQFWRKSSRIKMDGTHMGLLNDSKHLSALSVVRHTRFIDHNFLFGNCEIDYTGNTINGTLYEMYKDTDAESDLAEIYEYKYLFE